MKNKKEILGFILKKFFKLITLLIALCIVTFILLEKSPLDPVQAYVGADLTVTQEQRENIAEYWGLNKPPLERFSSWYKLKRFYNIQSRSPFNDDSTKISISCPNSSYI